MVIKMDYYKKFMISLSPHASTYADLIIHNCLHNYKETDDSLEIILNDKEFTNILYNLIIYGKLKSRTKKTFSTHSRLNSLDEDSKHFMSLEVEYYQRILFYLDKVLLFCLLTCIITFLLYLFF